MIEFIKKYVFDFIKASEHYFIPIAITSGILIYAPDTFIGISIGDFRKEAHSYLGAVFIFSSMVVLSSIVTSCLKAISNFFRKIYERFLFHRKIKRRLEGLTPEEKNIIRVYLEKETRTTILAYSGVVRSLLDAKIIYPIEDIIGERAPFNIQPWAWDYFKAHPSLISAQNKTSNKALHWTA